MSESTFIDFVVHMLAASLHMLIVRHIRTLPKKDYLLKLFQWNMIGCVVFHFTVAGTLMTFSLYPELAPYFQITNRITLVLLAGTFAPLFLGGLRSPSRFMSFGRLLIHFEAKLFLYLWFAYGFALLMVLDFLGASLPGPLIFLSRFGSLVLVFGAGALWFLFLIVGMKPDASLGIRFNRAPYRIVITVCLLVYLASGLNAFTEVTNPLARFSSVLFGLVFAWDRFRFVFLDNIVRRGVQYTGLGLGAYGVFLGYKTGLPLSGFEDLNMLFNLYLFILLIWSLQKLDPLLDRLWFGKPIDRALFTMGMNRILEQAETREQALAQTQDYLCRTFPAQIIVGQEPDGDDDPDTTRISLAGEEPLHIHMAPLKGIFPWYSMGRELVRTAALLLQSHLRVIAIQERRRLQEVRVRELAELATRAELSALRAQIRPHFLFNVLNTIHAFVKSEPDKAEETIELLADLMRGVLEASKEDFFPLHKELDLARTYLEIEQARHGARLRFTIDNQISSATRVPAFSLQPLVENAVKHGLDRRQGVCEIALTAQERDGQLLLSVTDNGPGLVGEPSQGTGTALNNIKERLRRLYGTGASFSLCNGETEGAVARLILPKEIPS